MVKSQKLYQYIFSTLKISWYSESVCKFWKCVYTKVTKQTMNFFLNEEFFLKTTGLILINVTNPKMQVVCNYEARWPLSSTKYELSKFSKVLHFDNPSARRTKSNDKEQPIRDVAETWNQDLKVFTHNNWWVVIWVQEYCPFQGEVFGGGGR